MGIASNLTAATSGIGNEAVEASAAIKAKRQMLDEYQSASKPKTAPVGPARPAAPSNIINPKARFGDRKGEKRIPEAAQWAKPLGSLKKGGKIKKTGVYKLHKKEAVVPAKVVSGLSKVLGGKK